MELLDGVLGSDVARIRSSSCAGKVASTVDSARFARQAATMYLDMIFRDGFYHADPHPGNYVILPGGVVGVLDCGMVGRLDDELRDDIEAALLAVAERDVEELVERVVHLGAPPPDLDRQALRADLAEFVADYGARPIKELDLGAALGEVIDIVARYRILLPPNASLLLRTLIVLEGSARQLDPEFSLMDLIADYRARSPGCWLMPKHWLRNTRRAVRDYDRLFRLLPEDLSDIVHRLRTGTFALEHDHRHLQASVHRLVEGLITASLLLSSALLLSQSDVTLAMPLRLMLGLAFLGLAGLLGFRLFRSIHAAESGRRE